MMLSHNVATLTGFQGHILAEILTLATETPSTCTQSAQRPPERKTQPNQQLPPAEFYRKWWSLFQKDQIKEILVMSHDFGKDTYLPAAFLVNSLRHVTILFQQFSQIETHSLDKGLLRCVAASWMLSRCLPPPTTRNPNNPQRMKLANFILKRDQEYIPAVATCFRVCTHVLMDDADSKNDLSLVYFVLRIVRCCCTFLRAALNMTQAFSSSRVIKQLCGPQPGVFKHACTRHTHLHLCLLSWVHGRMV